MKTQHPQHRFGFTAVEFLITIAILIVIVALFLPRKPTCQRGVATFELQEQPKVYRDRAQCVS